MVSSNIDAQWVRVEPTPPRLVIRSSPVDATHDFKTTVSLQTIAFQLTWEGTVPRTAVVSIQFPKNEVTDVEFEIVWEYSMGW